MQGLFTLGLRIIGKESEWIKAPVLVAKSREYRLIKIFSEGQGGKAEARVRLRAGGTGASRGGSLQS